MKMKLTQREVRVILNSIDEKCDQYMFNDKRKNGGRIKIWGTQLSEKAKGTLQTQLQVLFPKLNIEVRDWHKEAAYSYYNKGTSTCVYWKEKTSVKPSCNGKVVEIDGKKYELKELA